MHQGALGSCRVAGRRLSSNAPGVASTRVKKILLFTAAATGAGVSLVAVVSTWTLAPMTDGLTAVTLATEASRDSGATVCPGG